MSDDNVVPLTNVASFLKEREKLAKLTDPEQCLELLNQYAGNVGAFAAYFTKDAGERQWVMFKAENLMAESHLYAQWKTAIKTNQVIRLRQLQNMALLKLELMSEIKEQDGLVLLGKQSEELSLAKLVLADFVAGQTMQAKTKDAAPGTGQSSTLHSEDEGEDNRLEQARGY